MNPYAILGIRKNASLKTITSAYRRLAKSNHPDHCPGDEQAAARFNDVRKAYEVLSDPVRREAYDRTGSVEEVKPVNPCQEFAVAISPLLAQLVQQMAKGGVSASANNVVEMLGKGVQEMQEKLKERLAELKASHKMLVDVAARFTVKEEGDENVLASIAKSHLQLVENDLKTIAAEQEKFARVAVDLKKYGYLFMPAMMLDGFLNMGTATSVSGWRLT